MKKLCLSIAVIASVLAIPKTAEAQNNPPVSSLADCYGLVDSFDGAKLSVKHGDAMTHKVKVPDDLDVSSVNLQPGTLVAFNLKGKTVEEIYNPQVTSSILGQVEFIGEDSITIATETGSVETPLSSDRISKLNLAVGDDVKVDTYDNQESVVKVCKVTIAEAPAAETPFFEQNVPPVDPDIPTAPVQGLW